MYLRSYAYCRRQRPSKSEEELRKDAAFRMTYVLTAPVLATMFVVAAIYGRAHRITHDHTRIEGQFLILLLLGVCLAIYFYVYIAFRSYNISEEMLKAYDTRAQRIYYMLETIFDVVCIVTGLLVGIGIVKR